MEWMFENTTRSRHVFAVTEPKGKTKRPVIVDRVIFGDSADRVEHVPGQRDELLQPNPIRTVAKTFLERLDAVSRRVFLEYVEKGVLRLLGGDRAALLALLAPGGATT